MINICINLPSGKSVFSSVHQVVGDESLDHLYLKQVMLAGPKEVYKTESGGLSRDCLGFIGDSESANLCALRELESECLENPVDPDEADSKSTALPRLAVETRFASMILTMRDVLRCQAALEALAVSSLIADEYEFDALRDTLLDSDTWTTLKRALGMLGPISDIIHNIEADR
ncbi:hypothetical protein WJX77_006456 [Trebouxia sp. C0004]